MKTRRGGERAYVKVSYPWAAAFQADSGPPRRYLASLIRQALRFGMPARRYGALGARLVRAVAATGAPGQALRLFPKGTRSEIDARLRATTRDWADLAAASRWLPDSPPELSALVLERRAARTYFLFGDGDRPLLVCKEAREDAGPLELEREALEEAAPAETGPRFLGLSEGAYVQEGLPGDPLPVDPVTPTTAGALRWTRRHEELGRGLRALAKETTRSGPPEELNPEVRAALDSADVDAGIRRTAATALDDLADLDVAVLRHGDTSAQNCLFSGEKLIGLVDWEIARLRGAPGFDLMNAAVALIDHGVGLIRWSEERAWDAFRAAWTDSEFFARARSEARALATGAGASDDEADKLEIAFFARRLASRLARPANYATGPAVAARMLELVCER